MQPNAVQAELAAAWVSYLYANMRVFGLVKLPSSNGRKYTVVKGGGRDAAW